MAAGHARVLLRCRALQPSGCTTCCAVVPRVSVAACIAERCLSVCLWYQPAGPQQPPCVLIRQAHGLSCNSIYCLCLTTRGVCFAARRSRGVLDVPADGLPSREEGGVLALLPGLRETLVWRLQALAQHHRFVPAVHRALCGVALVVQASMCRRLAGCGTRRTLNEVPGLRPGAAGACSPA